MAPSELKLTRRNAMAGMTGLVIGLYLPSAGRAQSGAARALATTERSSATFAPNAFVRVSADDTVTVLSKHIEFGQGPFTGLATLVAEEMDADWSKVRAEHAPSDPVLYKNLAFGIQGTGGSSAIANSYEQMRQAGAAARAMLVSAAAKSWGVPAREITVENGVLRHARTNKQGRFGQFAVAAAKLPVPKSVQLKDPSTFKYIGAGNTRLKKLDSAVKSNGSAQYAIDIREPGMLTVVVARAPLFGAKVARFDAEAARAIQGVVDVKEIPSGVAVYANGMWPALKGREALRITWDESGAERRGSDELLAQYRELARQPGLVARTHGNPGAAFEHAEKTLEAEFVFPYLAHAPMEPLDGVIQWDGQQARARFGSQFQTGEHGTIAGILGLPTERVAVETLLAGGSFGRRAQPNMHFSAELAHVAKAIGPSRPVKLVWTRDDDIRGGYYRPMYVHRLRGAVSGGRIVGWSNTVVGQSILKGSPFAAMIQNGVDATSVEGSRELLYEIENFRCDLHTTEVGIPVLWWRSVGHTHTGYAVECFVDELLQSAGLDPIEGRLAMMAKSKRAAGVLRAVAELAKWTGPQVAGGRARGVAVVESFGSFVAQIVEASVGNDDVPTVHKVWCAVDCGVAVNPDVIRAQMEGGIGFALGHALFAEVTFKDGRPVQANFDTYRSLRIHEMPEVEVAIVKSSEKPTGVGEPGVPPLAPALANAMARLGVQRPRQLPMVRRHA
jgi:isoquinoline 1-oxidoreductase beta subunit